MPTISKVVERIVKANPGLEIMLSKDLISYSKLARYIKKEVKEETGREVNDSAIIVAIKRLQEKAGRVYERPAAFTAKSMTTHSNLMEIVVLNSSDLPHKIPKIYAFPEIDEGAFLNISENRTQTTFLFSETMERKVKNVLAGEKILVELKGISLISLSFGEEMFKTPGFTVYVLKEVAWNGINIIELISTYTEMTVVVDSKVLTKTYNVLERVLFT